MTTSDRDKVDALIKAAGLGSGNGALGILRRAVDTMEATSSFADLGACDAMYLDSGSLDAAQFTHDQPLPQRRQAVRDIGEALLGIKVQGPTDPLAMWIREAMDAGVKPSMAPIRKWLIDERECKRTNRGLDFLEDGVWKFVPDDALKSRIKRARKDREPPEDRGVE